MADAGRKTSVDTADSRKQGEKGVHTGNGFVFIQSAAGTEEE